MSIRNLLASQLQRSQKVHGACMRDARCAIRQPNNVTNCVSTEKICRTSSGRCSCRQLVAPQQRVSSAEVHAGGTARDVAAEVYYERLMLQSESAGWSQAMLQQTQRRASRR